MLGGRGIGNVAGVQVGEGFGDLDEDVPEVVFGEDGQVVFAQVLV